MDGCVKLGIRILLYLGGGNDCYHCFIALYSGELAENIEK